MVELPRFAADADYRLVYFDARLDDSRQMASELLRRTKAIAVIEMDHENDCWRGWWWKSVPGAALVNDYWMSIKFHSSMEWFKKSWSGQRSTWRGAQLTRPEYQETIVLDHMEWATW